MGLLRGVGLLERVHISTRKNAFFGSSIDVNAQIHYFCAYLNLSAGHAYDFGSGQRRYSAPISRIPKNIHLASQRPVKII